MRKRIRTSAWRRSVERQFVAIARLATAAGTRAVAQALKPRPPPKTAPKARPLARPPSAPAPARRTPAPAAGTWAPGVAVGTAGARRYRLYRPPGIGPGERLPLMVMLHGCGQDAEGFAASTRMNHVALRERFFVLYPEQDRLANTQRCWNWYDTGNGRAYGEAALVLNAIDQVCRLYPVDRDRVAVAGLSAGASLAALLAARHPERFAAVVMHSGVPPGTAHSPFSALGAMNGQRPTLPLAAGPGAAASAWPPLLVIHGAADAVVSPHNGLAAVRIWAEAAGARPGEAQAQQRGRRHAMVVTHFQHRGATAATLVVVEGLGHAWSGGAAGQPFSDAQGPDASRMAWAFAARQFRAPRRAAVGAPPRHREARALATETTDGE